MAKENLRNRKIDARFTEEEYKQIADLALVLGLRKTDLVRRRLLSDGGQVLINTKTLLEELNKAGTELGRSGNNINQLARHANRLSLSGQLSAETLSTFNDLFAVHLEKRRILEGCLRKILRVIAGGYRDT